MDKREIVRLFLYFLKENHILDSYISNFQKAENTTMLLFFQWNSRLDYINAAFDWEDTIEGDSFWGKYNSLWHNKLKSYEKQQ